MKTNTNTVLTIKNIPSIHLFSPRNIPIPVFCLIPMFSGCCLRGTGLSGVPRWGTPLRRETRRVFPPQVGAQAP